MSQNICKVMVWVQFVKMTGCFMHGMFEFLQQADPSIAYLELVAVAAAMLTWAERFQNKRIILHCDNMSVVQMINNTTSVCKNCMILIRKLVLHSMYNNLRVYAKYIPTKKNYLADSLSRLKIQKFLQLAHSGMNRNATQVPGELFPLSKNWIY